MVWAAMRARWFLFWVCLILIAGSAVGAWAALQARAEDVRGWEQATETFDLPYRLPLAGVNVELTQVAPDDLARELDRIAAAGFTWVRQPFLWAAIEPEPGVYAWGAYDALVQAVAARDGLALVAVLDGTPPWARHELAPEHPYAPPASVIAYGRFAGAVAARYADAIAYYQVWDEPNITSHWGELDPRPAHYVAMLREAYTAIHAADATASVIAAALAPTVERGPHNLSDVLYLRALYDLGGRDFFDAAAGKPYGFSTGPDDRRVDERVLNFSRLILLREEMVRRGDGDKPLWGSNFGWNALPDDWRGPPSIWGSVTAQAQLQYTQAAYERARREWPWIGGLILQHWGPDAPADDPIQGFAVAPRVAEWLAGGLRLSDDALIPGQYPALNAHTAYSENWRFSDLGADAELPAGSDAGAVENRITAQFEGTEFAIVLRRDDYLAYLIVTVDGRPANALPRNRQGEAFIVLTSPERTPELGLIRVAEGLANGPHTVEIVHRPAQGDDRWPIAGFAVAVAPDTAATDRALLACGIVGGLALLGLVFAAWRLPWGQLAVPAPQTFRRFLEWLLSLFVSFVLLLGTLVTWGEAFPALLRRDQPALAVTILTAGIAALSPAFVITLASLVVLVVLVYNRPLFGLMLILFWSAFFLSTLDLLFSAFTTVEVYLALTVAALLARAAVDWARHRRRAEPLRVALRLTRLDWLALAFAALGVVSLSWSEFLTPALRQLRVVVLEPVLFYFLIRWLRLARRDLLWLGDALLFTGGAIAVVGLYLYATGESVVEAEDGARRLISVYGSPNGVGMYLGRCLPFALAYVLVAPRGSWRWLYGALGGAVMLLAVLLSQSRGAILLGLPAALIVTLVFWRGRRSLAPVIGAVLVLLTALVPLALLLPRLGDLLGSTATFRRHLWYSAWQLIRERPLTGVGLDQFLYWYRSRYLLPEAWEEPNLSIPHTLVLNHWVSLGILGVILALALQVVFWRRLWRLRGQVVRSDSVAFMLVLGLAGSMADFLAHGLVDVGYFAINLAFVFFLSLGLLHRLEDMTPGARGGRR
ncbi:MAG: O-antigen ligase family protein [Chloroflexota bacterium]